MIRRQKNRVSRVALLVPLSCALLSACGSEGRADYCRDHFLIHDEHRAEIALLDMVLADAGSLSTELVLPTRIFDRVNNRKQSIIDSLQVSGAIYSMAQEDGCSQTDSLVTEQSGTITARYQSQCTAGRDLNQVNISMFDLLPELDEVEVTIKTDATAKHFVINRQCSAAIFRINKQ